MIWPVGIVMSMFAMQAEAWWFDRFVPVPIVEETETFDCRVEGSEINLAFEAGQTITTGIIFSNYAYAFNLAGKADYSDHRYYRIWASEQPGPVEDADPRCVAESAPGDLNPRITALQAAPLPLGYGAVKIETNVAK